MIAKFVQFARLTTWCTDVYGQIYGTSQCFFPNYWAHDSSCVYTCLQHTQVYVLGLTEILSEELSLIHNSTVSWKRNVATTFLDIIANPDQLRFKDQQFLEIGLCHQYIIRELANISTYGKNQPLKQPMVVAGKKG